MRCADAPSKPGGDSTGAGLAVFPGAFRPPHVNHYVTVADLAAREDVGTVVVVVANRTRDIPGTTKVLDVDVAVRVWHIYLRHLPNVRVEVADGSAVAHALGYADRGVAGDTLLICTGKDIRRGDGKRVRGSIARARARGVRASVAAGSPNVMDVHATALRTMLANGARDRGRFESALPSHLAHEERLAVWNICHDAMVEQQDILRRHLRHYCKAHCLGSVSDISLATAGKRDGAFRIEFEHRDSVYAKCARDTVSAAQLGGAQRAKPRKRLKVERAALKYVAALSGDTVEVPRVVHFDKSSQTLVLTEICAEGSSLDTVVRSGRGDARIASAAARFLARMHLLHDKIKPLRDSLDEDVDHWRRTLAQAVGTQAPVQQSIEVRDRLAALEAASNAASGPCLVHLDFRASNILVGKRGLGFIDFESSSSWGDPAYDLGLIISDFLLWGIARSRIDECCHTVAAGLRAYRDEAPASWSACRPRVASFVGANLLHQRAQTCNDWGTQGNLSIEHAALRLLSIGQCPAVEPNVAIVEAVARPW